MKNKKKNIGYKVTNPDMTCLGFQYELGKKFTHKGEISFCQSGFHFCLNPSDCFNYYPFNPDNRVFEIEYGSILTEGDKSITSEIFFLREIPWQEVY